MLNQIYWLRREFSNIMSDAEYEYEEVSDEEKLKIATAFLLQSPPGQFSDVLKGNSLVLNLIQSQEKMIDVKKLVPSHILTPSAVHEIARLHNTATFISSPIDENRNVRFSRPVNSTRL